jgi:hypothetical protein
MAYARERPKGAFIFCNLSRQTDGRFCNRTTRLDVVSEQFRVEVDGTDRERLAQAPCSPTWFRSIVMIQSIHVPSWTVLALTLQLHSI